MDHIDFALLQSRIKSLSLAISCKEISKGFTTIERKYIINLSNGEKYLLRIASISQFDRKLTSHRVLNDLLTYNVKSPLPIDVGKLEDLGICYQLLSYIEGEDAEESMRHYTDQEQFQIGVDAGKDLAKMHLLKAPGTVEPWSTRAINKHNRYLDAYKTCGIKIVDDYKILDFINENVKYLENRPNQFQHDDFHVGNIILRDKKYKGVIDFNNHDWGDPIHDFHKLALLNREVSIPFSVGQISGYYENSKMPEHFWTIYCLYVAMGVFSVIAWSIRFTPHRIEKEVERLYNILEDHKYFELLEPKWFSDYK